ncbi:MAG: thrombospondin type 3 repeat-containing protein, partial [Dehalococcoidia bacterium]
MNERKMCLRGLLFVAVAGLTLLTLLLLGSSVKADPPPFPVFASVDVDNTGCMFLSDIERTFGVLDDPWPAAMYQNHVSFTPNEWYVAEADDAPIGALVGQQERITTLGLINSPCTSILSPSFTLLNCTVDPYHTLSFDDQFFDFNPANGIPDGCDRWPMFLDDLFPGLTPIARMGGFTSISGVDVSLNILIFEPGTFLPLIDLPSFSPDYGYIAVSVFNDPGAPLAPDLITDSCLPMLSATTVYGSTHDNPSTVEDESDHVWRVNPLWPGIYPFYDYANSIRDADGDGIDNELDTCPHIPCSDPDQCDPKSLGGDDDGDGLDNDCDPLPDMPPEKFSLDGDAYPNRQDNCPLVWNDDQLDSDYDGIGDACDQDDWNDDGDIDDPGEPTGFDPDTPDGDMAEAWLENDIAIDGPAACAFNPVADVSLSSNESNANADITTSHDIPTGDYNFDRHIHFVPAEFDRGTGIPIGAYVADLDTVSTLGLLNNVCITALPVSFEMLNASVDTSDTVSFEDSLVDMDGNTLPDGVDKYPDFLNTLFPGLTPSLRMFSVTSVAGTPISMNMVEFAPGTALYGIAFDPALGRPSVQVLNDPTAPPAPGSITDFCTPLSAASTIFGVSRNNPATAADESGYVVSHNPTTAGDYTFTTYTTSLGDADGDCIENDLDTCPFDINEGDPRVAGDGDPDNDGMDNACDPEPDVADTDYDNDVYLNRGDNCPLVANSDNADADGDLIGDACDPNPNTPDGEARVAWLETDIEIIEAGPGPLLHVSPDGSDYTGNPYCPDTDWSGGKNAPVVNPWHDCNNITSQNHVIRTDGWDPAHHWLWSWNLENFSGASATILAQGECGTILEVTGRPDWDAANDDEQCLVIHSSTPGETRVTLTYEEDGVVIITPPAVKEWDSLAGSVILNYGDLEEVGDWYLPKDVNDDGVRNAEDEHELDRQSTWQDHEVIWDEALKRVKSPVPVEITEIVHGEHEVLIDAVPLVTHHPTQGALVLAEIESERNCTYFTDEDGSADYGTILPNEVSDNLGRLTVYMDTVCEEQAIIHFYAQFPHLPDSVREGLHEWIGINWTTVELAKQPQIRWAGEEIVLERRWALPDDWFPNVNADGTLKDICPHVFNIARYNRLSFSTAGDLVVGLPEMLAPYAEPDRLYTIVDADCISAALASSEDQGEGDFEVTGHEWVHEEPPVPSFASSYDLRMYLQGYLEQCNAAIEDGDATRAQCIADVHNAYYETEWLIETYLDPDGFNLFGALNRHAFLVWWLKIYQVKLTNVEGEREFQNTGNWSPAGPWDTSSDVVAEERNVSSDALVRVRVKGWFEGGNNSSRGVVCVDLDGDGDEAGSPPGEPYPLVSYEEGCTDLDDEIVDHGHWVLPDDLEALAGPNAINTRPNWDVMSEPDDAKTAAIGPKSTLDSHDSVLRPWLYDYKTVVPDGAITEADAIMPPLKIRARIADGDAGFLKEALKGVVYGNTNDYHSIMIPSHWAIPAMVNDGGYDWASWNMPGCPDGDGDGVSDADTLICNADDLCPADFDPTNGDLDSDDVGDACDPDIDGDTVLNASDNCVLKANDTQVDADSDGIGDACDIDDATPGGVDDRDSDGDTVPDYLENCVTKANATQVDTDLDGYGDACDAHPNLHYAHTAPVPYMFWIILGMSGAPFSHYIEIYTD